MSCEQSSCHSRCWRSRALDARAAERWDGEGYPRGLSGDEIPLSARILSLADVYDALTTSRPYKEAWSHQRAMEWIAERGGTQFDPEVISVFLSRAALFNSERERLADSEAHIELS